MIGSFIFWVIWIVGLLTTSLFVGICAVPKYRNMMIAAYRMAKMFILAAEKTPIRRRIDTPQAILTWDKIASWRNVTPQVQMAQKTVSEIASGFAEYKDKKPRVYFYKQGAVYYADDDLLQAHQLEKTSADVLRVHYPVLFMHHEDTSEDSADE